MAIALNNTIQNLRFRFVNGPAGQFFRWWGEELRNAMPAQLRARMQYARRHLLIQVNEEEISLSVDDAASIQNLDTFMADQDVQLQQQQVRELLLQHELAESIPFCTISGNFQFEGVPIKSIQTDSTKNPVSDVLRK